MSHHRNWSWKPPQGTEKTLQDGNKRVREFHKREAAKYIPIKKLGGEKIS